MAVVPMKALLESGVHFGHRTHRWHPRMKPYIFTERNGIHIINLQITSKALTEAYNLIRDTVADGGVVLFVGTKRQAVETIEEEAIRCGMPYVTVRWLGGMLTNFRTIRDRINELEMLERRRDSGEFDRLTKKEALMLNRQIEKLDMRFSGTRNMVDLPDLLFVVDVRREETSIHEANLLDIPVIAMVDTNCDPNEIDYVIPSNDDAIRAIKLMVGKIADAVVEGKAMRKEEEDLEAAASVSAAIEAPDAELTDEELLGAATLAKMREAEEEEAARAAEEAFAAAEAQAEAADEAAEEAAEEAEEAVAEAEAEVEAAVEAEAVEADAEEAAEEEESAEEAEEIAAEAEAEEPVASDDQEEDDEDEDEDDEDEADEDDEDEYDEYDEDEDDEDEDDEDEDDEYDEYDDEEEDES
ncbi:MAG: 30S ribosomal protein S2 [Anaerolineales bacterium]|nr:30S ribosomal protein S2 [Anaerolineales bacterium]